MSFNNPLNIPERCSFWGGLGGGRKVYNGVHPPSTLGKRAIKTFFDLLTAPLGVTRAVWLD